MTTKTRIAFIIPSLTTGGAERQLCNLAQHMDRALFDVHVFVFYTPGEDINGKLWEEGLTRSGAQVHYFHKRPGPLGYVLAFPRILGLMFRVQPRILHGYAGGNFIALLLGVLFRKPVVWGIRRTSRDLSNASRLSLWLLKVKLWLSGFVDLVIFNSEAGRLNHQRMGLRASRVQVVPNGFNTQQFVPDSSQGLAQRQLWEIATDVPLIGIVGRLDPAKDHPTFLRAAKRLSQEWPTAKFICVGGGAPDYTKSLQQLAESLGISDRVIWTGSSSSMTAAYNALSILVLSSVDEGFPNVVGEAMACGIPCVATNVGDAASIVGNTGFVAEIGDDEALATGVSALLQEREEDRMARTKASRERICTEYSIEVLARNTERALLSL